MIKLLIHFFERILRFPNTKPRECYKICVALDIDLEAAMRMTSFMLTHQDKYKTFRSH